ncbi:MAG TPA: DMP19 family protein [Firmicutes bacterium]|nr:DMP19 family protein [Bacillota bacterium]
MGIDIRDVWNIQNKEDFLIAVNSWLCRKSDNGSNLPILSTPERTVYLTLQLEAEVNNGGFIQYFYNAYGDISADLVASFKAIGAEKTAAICRKAICALNEKIPVDKIQREEFLDHVMTDQADQILSACDREFYRQPDDLEELNYHFIIKHKSWFC